MTQAFNLSQLANRANTSGQLDASTGLYNQTPVANGGTGKSTVTAGRLLVGAGTSAMTELSGATTDDVVKWNGTAWVSGASTGAAMPTVLTFVSPSPAYNKPATIKGIKVTVVGAGGNGGSNPASPSNQTVVSSGGGGGGAAIKWIPAPSILGPVPITAGPGTNSFGTFCSATAGGAGTSGALSVGGPAGIGSNGDLNIQGNGGYIGDTNTPVSSGNGGGSVFGGGGIARRVTPGTPAALNGNAGGNYGGGGSGSIKFATTAATTGGTGAPGIVIIEEFY